ncbi:MAG: ATP-binding cassette domain-containing protein [Paracoccaceae bacterium]
MTAPALLALEGLSLRRPDGVEVLAETALDLRAGEIVLLCGPSGVGKSALLKTLAGVSPDGWRATGRTGDALLGSRALGTLVFQNFVLFEDLTARQNLEIVRDHAGPIPEQARAAAEALIAPFADGRPQTLSGGQRQKTAIARALATGRRLLLLDEPNSGLDPDAERALMAMLRRLADELGLGILIVAHHTEALMPAADRVLWFDPGTRALCPLPNDGQALEAARAGRPPASLGRPPPGPTTPIPPRPARIRARWLGWHLGRDLWLHGLAPEMLLYMAVASLVIGFTGTWFALRNLPLESYLLPVLGEDLLRNIGFATVRIIVPLLVAVLIAGRSSAVIAARFAEARYSGQIAAMRNAGVPFGVYWIGATGVALVTISCLLSGAVLLGASYASLQTFLLAGGAVGPDPPPADLWREAFWSRLLDAEWRTTAAFLMLKAVGSGALTAAVAIGVGLRRLESAFDIRRAVTLAISGSTCAVLLFHTLVAVFEFG